MVNLPYSSTLDANDNAACLQWQDMKLLRSDHIPRNSLVSMSNSGDSVLAMQTFFSVIIFYILFIMHPPHPMCQTSSLMILYCCSSREKILFHVIISWPACSMRKRHWYWCFTMMLLFHRKTFVGSICFLKPSTWM